MFDLHENQLNMETEWDNTTMAETFKPLTDKDIRKGWKSVYDVFVERVKSVRGLVAHVPLTYFMHTDLHPKNAALDPSEGYVDFDHELILAPPSSTS